MCGIFGIAIQKDSGLAVDDIRKLVDSLFILAETRGKEAAGCAVRSEKGISVYKTPERASRMICTREFEAFFTESFGGGFKGDTPAIVIGHSRLVTNGIQVIPQNNQPVICDGLVSIHNGIIVNDKAIWEENPSLERHADVDTEAYLALVSQSLANGDNLLMAVSKAYKCLEGTAATATLLDSFSGMVLTTNNGSLYTYKSGLAPVFVFASERYMLQRFITHYLHHPESEAINIQAIMPNEGISFCLQDFAAISFNHKAVVSGDAVIPKAVFVAGEKLSIMNFAERQNPEHANLRRCTRCILPETMPFITFDAQGVCNYCHDFQPLESRGIDALKERLGKYKRNDGRPEVLVGVSGGRDSCYGLHVLVRELGVRPVAFTYDWGMITDLARRNQARLCGKLGVEHILLSADIATKRRYVRKNIEAWLKRPELGMIPLFMAGDKHYFHYVDEIKKQNDVELSVFCENRLERAYFKSGFAGLPGSDRVFDVGFRGKMKILSYYGLNYLTNPSYLNESLWDTLFAFYSSYMLRHDRSLMLFEYVPWEENTVIETLRSEYDWELATDTKSTWRIGDGTAAFYNYIYYTVAGFTEADALRSNQIRQGQLERGKALELVREENRPRWQSLDWYAHTIGFNLNEALQRINSIPKLYKTR